MSNIGPRQERSGTTGATRLVLRLGVRESIWGISEPEGLILGEAMMLGSGFGLRGGAKMTTVVLLTKATRTVWSQVM